MGAYKEIKATEEARLELLDPEAKAIGVGPRRLIQIGDPSNVLAPIALRAPHWVGDGLGCGRVKTFVDPT